MKTTISAQQSAFFTQLGYIEFEIPHPPLPAANGRDLWRQDPTWQTFLLRKLGPIALTLSGKKQLRLGCDQKGHFPEKRGQLKEFLSLQRLAVGVILADHPVQPPKRSPLGILPLPSTPSHALFFRPDLLLDWPAVQCELYLAVFVLPTAVYVHNPADPFGPALKTFGYQFGDCLQTEHHPLIIS